MSQVAAVDLDPSLVDSRTYATRQRRHIVDTGFLLSGMITLACVIPASERVPQLTDLGRPTTMLALFLVVVWALSRLHPGMTTRGPQPIRWVVIAYLVATLMSYIAALGRGLPTIEANGADRAILQTLVLVGPMLAFADGVPSRARLDGIIRAFVYSAAVMAFIGLVQSSLRIDLTQYVHIPGLSGGVDPSTGVPDAGRARDGVASTATHYIEFGTVMALALPFAVHVARFADTAVRRRWVPSVPRSSSWRSRWRFPGPRSFRWPWCWSCWYRCCPGGCGSIWVSPPWPCWRCCS